MANFGNIIEWVLRLEDRTLSGKIVNLGDGAGLTRFGLTVRDEGSVVPPNYFSIMKTADALEAAKQVYYDKYWTPIRGTQIASDELAATLMSFAVNDGVKTAVELLQRTVGMQSSLYIDGVMGPNTLAAISGQDATVLAERFRDAQEARYLKIEAERPADVKFDVGWRKRAYARYPDLP